jgi:hypothetical protein
LNRVLDVGTGTGIWAIDFGEPSVLINEKITDTQLPFSSGRTSRITGICSGLKIKSALTVVKVIGIDLSPIQPSLYV